MGKKTKVTKAETPSEVPISHPSVSLTQLKAFVYEQLLVKEQAERTIQQLQQEIQRREKAGEKNTPAPDPLPAKVAEDILKHATKTVPPSRKK